MKNTKAGQKIVYGIFIIGICLVWVMWTLFQRYSDTNNYENRELTLKPRLTVENYLDYSQLYTKYINDNMPFRNAFIQLNSRIDYYLFKRSSNKNVLIGKNGWLFYSEEVNGISPLDDYQGLALYTTEELERIADNCIKQRDYLHELNTEFAIFIAPDKERVYSEWMADKYGEPSYQYRALQLYNYLKQNTDLNIIYPINEISEAKKKTSYDLYYKTDTHWNHIGGYVGSTALLKAIGVKIPNIWEDGITISSGDHMDGDMAGMLNLTKQLRNLDNTYIVDGYCQQEPICVEWDYHGMIRYIAEGTADYKTYVLRDSFCTYMIDYVGSQFRETCFRNKETFIPEDIIVEMPDIVVYEVVARNSRQLESFSLY